VTNLSDKHIKTTQLPKRVVVIGAGIAGLTAAHELAERGYEVEVIEKTCDPYLPHNTLIGGMARTSWARVPPPPTTAPSLSLGETPAADTAMRGEAPWFKTASGADVLGLVRDDSPLPTILTPDRMRDELTAGKTLVPLPSPAVDGRIALIATTDNEHAATASSILEALGPVTSSLARAWIERFMAGHTFTLNVLRTSTKAKDYLQVGRESDRVPGEHGFRFFPSFYHHLFDTMSRIPLPEAALAAPAFPGTVLQADSSRTALDNLVVGTAMELGYRPRRGGESRTFSVPRLPLRSPEALKRLLANALEKAGYRGQDVVRLLTRYLEYMTSCSERRREYEDRPWADFLELSAPGKYSSYFHAGIDGGAQALVAMSTSKNDARTIGSVAMQLTIDEMRNGRCTDGILDGPTTTALFDPWQSYLRSIGVRFTVGELTGFHVEGMAVRPVITTPVDRDSGTRVEVAPADYYVMAIPLVNFRAAAKQVETKLRNANTDCLALEDPVNDALPHEDQDDVAKYMSFELNDCGTSPDEGPLRNMCGVQFFFGPEVSLLQGHAICVDSPWGVCYVSQVQYWQDRQRGGNGVRGVISATFTQFQVPARGHDGARKAAIECTPAEIADRVWLQIEDTWNAQQHGPLPQPRFFYIDENLTHHPGETPQWTNATPYLVNDVGTWPKRGGVRTKDGGYFYQMQLGHTVFAGTFMRTRTRLNTMEAANESGRRAVNAILAHDRSNAPHCELWNIEDDEIPELLALRDLDRRIHRRGGKHLLRSSTVEALLAATPWDLLRLGLPTYRDVTGG
jgi:uncharacterized protein with NAD-binding domain and iron-sulfur cluster